MIVADTNVWARAFLGDDPRQSPKARKALAAARTNEGLFVPLIEMAELAWVLRGAEWERERVLATLESLCGRAGSRWRARNWSEQPSGRRGPGHGAASRIT